MGAFLAVVALAICGYFLVKPLRASKDNEAFLPQSFVVFDLETTGLDAAKHEIIEVAAIRYQKGEKTKKTYQALVKPKKKIPARITEITNITQEMVDRDGDAELAVLRGFLSFVGNDRLVTYNAEFDMAFMQAALQRNGLPSLANPVSCALKMARRAWPNRKSYKLDVIAEVMGINDGAAHRALEDSRRAMIVYAAAVASLRTIE